ncbi:MAG: carboxylating nicotinate-nucleotide diphosphorylase [Acidobacteriales bacterium]|nr:carboxylating nicotinate-nucleotide diphosphorylase [Terriglobales bacterium]
MQAQRPLRTGYNVDWHSRRLTTLLENALAEDRATHDVTTLATIDPQLRAAATIMTKEPCVLAGLGAVARTIQIYEVMNPDVIGHAEVTSHIEVFDGVQLHAKQAIAVIRHQARVLLSCERVILNLLQRMCGIATETRKFVDAVAGTGARILDTRKTVPGLRSLDKYAVRCGGGKNHRIDLADGILIKNNHIDLGGGIPVVLPKALQNRGGDQPVEAEVRNPTELEQALEYGAEAILLDNMTPQQVRECVARVRRQPKHILVEVSGGITLQNVRAYADAGADYLSVGALTHSVRAVDLNMRITQALY